MNSILQMDLLESLLLTRISSLVTSVQAAFRAHLARKRWRQLKLSQVIRLEIHAN